MSTTEQLVDELYRAAESTLDLLATDDEISLQTVSLVREKLQAALDLLPSIEASIAKEDAAMHIADVPEDARQLVRESSRQFVQCMELGDNTNFYKIGNMDGTSAVQVAWGAWIELNDAVNDAVEEQQDTIDESSMTKIQACFEKAAAMCESEEATGNLNSNLENRGSTFHRNVSIHLSHVVQAMIGRLKMQEVE